MPTPTDDVSLFGRRALYEDRSGFISAQLQDDFPAMEGCADSAPAHAPALCVPDASLVTAVDRSTTLSETLGFLGALLPDLSTLEPAVPIQPQLQTTTPLRHTPGATSAVLCPRPPPGGDPTLCELEVPRFPGLHVDVSVATGLDPAPFGEPEVPGHQDMGMPRADDDTAVPVTPTAHSVHDAPVDAADVGTLFIDSVRLPLQECLLQAPPCPRGQRREPENLIPRTQRPARGEIRVPRPQSRETG